jgi:tetraacyldisaccharide 4'-kinase
MGSTSGASGTTAADTSHSSGACTTWRRVISGEAHGPAAAVARGALSALSVPYGWAASLKDMVGSGGGVDVGLPVISVGNLTAGGTGKTPVVALVVEELVKRGRRPVILSRGYRARPGALNDEAQMLARSLPGILHLQGRDRVALARRAADAQLGDVLVLDDGFQYTALRRRLDVCCIDATNPFGYDAVLPRGLLREPMSALYRARPVLITRAEIAPASRVAEIRREVLRHNEHARIVVSEMRCTATADVSGAHRGEASELAGKRVLCASGIGNPAAFAADVRTLGARVVGHVEFADHHDWTAADLAGVLARARAVAAETVLVTQKDAVKLTPLPWPSDAPPLRVLHIEVAITEGTELWTRLLDEALAAA